MTRRRSLLAALAAALIVSAPGCGGGDEPAAPVAKPKPAEERADRGDRRSRPDRDGDRGATGGSEVAPPGTGGGSGQPTGGAPAGPQEDGPGNDVPPPPGSPAERFEQECPQGPESCGG